MPWSSVAVEELRLQVIRSAEAGLDNVSALCRSYGITRECFYKWKRRYAESGEAGLIDRSRAPLCQAGAVADELVELLARTREAHSTWGARKLRWFLERRHPQISLPAASTIHEILKRRGLVKHRKRIARAKVPKLGPASGAADVFCADFKGEFRLGDRSLCYPLTMQDMYSRQLLVCHAMPRIDGQAVIRQFIRAFKRFGMPGAVRTDNGAPFGAGGRLSPLSIKLVLLGIAVQRIQPGRPQQNGRLERLHRTLKAETTRPPANSLRGQQRRFDRFRHEYNEERPHEALGGDTPIQHARRGRREYTDKLVEPEYPGHYEVVRVNCKGYASWAGRRRYVSESLAGLPIALVEEAEDEWSVYFSNVTIARYNKQRDDWTPLSLY
jgi:transposase InsO family protein